MNSIEKYDSPEPPHIEDYISIYSQYLDDSVDRRGIFTSKPTFTGIVNHAASGDKFRNGFTGSLILKVNGSEVHSVNLETLAAIPSGGGYDTNGNIREFDADGDFTAGSTRKMRTAIFLNFSRLLTKDEIKKGSFVMKLHQ